jgi:hypothetical protein
MLSIGGSLGGASYGGGKVATDAFKKGTKGLTGGGGGFGLGQFAGGAMTVGSIMAEGLADNPLGIAKQAMGLGSMIPGIGTAFAVGSMALDVAGMFMDDGSGEKAYQEAYQKQMDTMQMEFRNQQREQMFQAQLEMVENQLENNVLSAWDAWSSEQIRLNEVYDKAAFTSQALLKQLVETRGAFAAGERYGKSAGRVANVSTLGAYGRSRAQLTKQLQSERSATMRSMKMTYRSLEMANQRALAKLAAPTMEIAPEPAYTDYTTSGLKQALQIGQSALTAVKKGYELTPAGDKFFGKTKPIKQVKIKKD